MTTVPNEAIVRFADTDDSYAPGMRLAPGDYRVAVSLLGYEPREGTVYHGDSPTVREVRLNKVETAFADALASGGSGPVMVEVPPGDYRRGCVSGTRCFRNELPLLSVTFDERFALSKYEITFAQYDRYTETTGNRRAPSRDPQSRGNRPVVNVSWSDAVAYADWLSSETGRRYRVPSESEWEYAVRARTTSAYSWGNDVGVGLANCAGCGELRTREGSAPVGSYAANPWGLHDMHGNVWEWVADCPTTSIPFERPNITQQIADSCKRRVRRGGSWQNSPRRMRAASRDVRSPDLRSPNTGFRVLVNLQ